MLSLKDYNANHSDFGVGRAQFAIIYNDSGLCSVFMMPNVRYIRRSWNNVLGDFLRWRRIMGPSMASAAAKPMKEKLKLFNLHFEEMCRDQSQWFIFYVQLREEIRIYL